jgi:hypothetical protein
VLSGKIMVELLCRPVGRSVHWLAKQLLRVFRIETKHSSHEATAKSHPSKGNPDKQ